MKSKSVTVACNKQLHDFIGILRTLHNVVLIISAFWTVSLMVVVLNLSRQMGDTICGYEAS